METSLGNNTPEYAVIVKKRNGKYLCYIRELALKASGDSLEEAFAKLEADKEVLISDYADSDILNELPKPDFGPMEKTSKFVDDLVLFSSKFLIAIVFCVFLILFASNQTHSLVSDVRADLDFKDKNIVNLLEDKLAQIVSHEVSEEGREKA